MAQAKITIKENSLYVGTVKKADFDPKSRSLVDFYNGGADMAAELLQFLKDSKEFGWESEELSDNKIVSAKDIWEIVPEAPLPTRKHLGDKSPNVAEWVQEKYPHIFKLRYPHGIWNKHEAGMGRNLAAYRDESNEKISKKAWERLKAEEQFKLDHARKVLEEASR